MALIVKCPKCGEQYKLENSFSGKILACADCEEQFEVPEAPAEGDFKTCPGCGHFAPENSAVCPDCAHGFLSLPKLGKPQQEAVADSGSLTVFCPKCGKDYKVDLSFGGKQLACECGKKFSIPEAPEEGGDWKFCPGCNACGAPENVICLECGHNFHTGKKVEAKKEKRVKNTDETFWFNYGGLVKKLVLLLVVLGVGFWIYRSYTAKPYGMSAAAPLGMFAPMDSFLKEAKFEVKEASAPPAFTGAKMYIYRNAKLAQQTKGTMDESLSVVKDNSGKVLAVGADYSIPTGAIAANGTMVSRFIRRLGEDIGFPDKPSFKAVSHGKGRWAWTENIYEAQKNGVKSYWTKVDHSQGLVESSHKKAFALEKYDPKKLAGGGRPDSPIGF